MLALVLVNAVPSGADIGVIVLEPVGPLGFFNASFKRVAQSIHLNDR